MIAFDPWTATFDEALAADEAYPGPLANPCRPLVQWLAAREVEALRPSIEAGDGFAVLDAASRCARQGLAMPDWLAREFLRRYDTVLHCRAGSWDVAFGRPYPKGSQLHAMRQRRAMRHEVWRIVADYTKRHPEASIQPLWDTFDLSSGEAPSVDAATADAVRRVGCASSKAQELYGEAVAMLGLTHHSAIRARLTRKVRKVRG